MERLARQATKEAPAREGGLTAVEGVVNTMYNPTSGVPYAREALRFLHRIGMTSQDAQWMVANATNPAKTAELIQRLEKQGMNREQAQRHLDEMRNALVLYSSQKEEG